jgi:hypothetical protein
MDNSKIVYNIDVIDTVLFYSGFMLYISLNITCPVLHVILTKRILNNINFTRITKEQYLQLSESSTLNI